MDLRLSTFATTPSLHSETLLSLLTLYNPVCINDPVNGTQVSSECENIYVIPLLSGLLDKRKNKCNPFLLYVGMWVVVPLSALIVV